MKSRFASGIGIIGAIIDGCLCVIVSNACGRNDNRDMSSESAPDFDPGFIVNCFCVVVSNRGGRADMGI